MLDYLNKKQFIDRSLAIPGGHWSPDALDARWEYHAKAIDILKGIGGDNPERILEIGTMGISLVQGSHTLDYAEKWDFPGKQPTYMHDARKTPWPIADKSYDLVVALRVFQHLTPVQHACFLEAKRIARRVLLVCPERYDTQLNPWSHGILFEEFVRWNENTPPTHHQETGMGMLYFWDEVALPPETRRWIRLEARVRFNLDKAKTAAKRNARKGLNLLLGKNK